MKIKNHQNKCKNPFLKNKIKKFIKKKRPKLVTCYLVFACLAPKNTLQ